jgi:hypothetical protein
MDYDLGYFDHETCRLEPLENPFGPKVLGQSPTALRAPALAKPLASATVDDEEPQPLCQEITTERVASIDDALAVIKRRYRRRDVDLVPG